VTKIATTAVLVIFQQGTPPEEAVASLCAFGDTILGWARVFEDRPLYAIKVSQEDAGEWKEALLRMHGVVWAEVMCGPPVFETPETYH